MKILIIIFISWFNSMDMICESPDDDSIISAIQHENLSYISECLTSRNINNLYGSDSIPLLHLALKSNKERVFQLLLHKGASTEIAYNGYPIIVSTVKSGNRKLVRMLLKHEAKVNATDAFGNNALMHAVLNKDLKMVKLLARKGANTEQENDEKINSRELSLAKGTMEITKFLKSAFERSLPSYIDGPHVEWNKPFTKAKVSYLVHDSVKQITKKITKRYVNESDTLNFAGFAGDSNHYTITKDPSPTTVNLDTSRNIFVMGDVHGDYRNLVLFLRKMKIIDSQNNWTWDNNYLVFIGDIFDRGNQVTECLWLIYKLEMQARRAGGEVVFILGNHELMVLENDLRYIAEKYYYLSEKLRLEYSRLFQPNMELGRWLRSKPVMAKAGNSMFVHGGISPEILQYELKMKDINLLVYKHLINNSEEISDTTGLLLGHLGPLWYRGLIDDNRFFKKIKKSELEKILAYFDVEQIIVGHTNVPRISSFYDGRVIAIDVPFYRTGDKNIMQGLIISEGKFQIVDYTGKKIFIH